MESKTKIQRPSSPREFFERLYGHLEVSKEKTEERTAVVSRPPEIFTPVPVLPTPLPFIFSPSEAQLNAAAVGLSAFCKNFFILFLRLVNELEKYRLFYNLLISIFYTKLKEEL